MYKNEEMKILVIIPAYNEEKNIKETVERLKESAASSPISTNGIKDSISFSVKKSCVALTDDSQTCNISSYSVEFICFISRIIPDFIKISSLYHF